MTAVLSASGARRPVSRASRMLGVVQLVRPLNFLMFLLGVLLGGILTAGLDAFRPPHESALLIAMISAALIGGGANAINDVFDLKIDRVNRPDRPLPSGKVTRRTAVTVWAVATGAGIGLSFLLTWFHVAIALVSAGMLYAYSARFKRSLLVGNLIVAAAVALALIYGGAAVGSPLPALVGATFAFLTMLAREIVKDVEDAEGDRPAGVRSLALTHGSEYAFRMAGGVVAVTVILTPVPFLFLGYGGAYLLFVGIASFLLLLSMWYMLGSPAEGERAAAGSASGWLKMAMAAGMLALGTAPFGA